MTLKTTVLLGVILTLGSCGKDQQRTADAATKGPQSKAIGDTVPEIGRRIRCIFQDSKNHYWYGSDNEGVFYYDGKSVIRFTDKDGLSHNQIRMIQEDREGNIWFGTGDGVSRFDGHKFSTVSNKAPQQLPLGGNTQANWKIGPDDLWFDGANGSVNRYDGNSLINLQLPRTSLDADYYAQYPNTSLSPYDVYCIFKDSKGNLWFGTASLGVCRYDGKEFTWFSNKELNAAAVRGIFEDKNGDLWFGNSGLGVFRYDGKTLTSFTEEKGLGNPDYVKVFVDRTLDVHGDSNLAREGTLASINSIGDDANGELWIATFDAGVWRYDGKRLTNYTVRDGLPTNAVMTVYKDRKGELWFGTSEEGVYKFNGTAFTKFAVH